MKKTSKKDSLLKLVLFIIEHIISIIFINFFFLIIVQYIGGCFYFFMDNHRTIYDAKPTLNSVE